MSGKAKGNQRKSWKFTGMFEPSTKEDIDVINQHYCGGRSQPEAIALAVREVAERLRQEQSRAEAQREVILGDLHAFVMSAGKVLT